MIKFTKMQALGNDYIYINCFQEQLDGTDVSALARAMSDRHFGVGSDGIILVCPSESGVEADVRMVMYNADGTRAEMCGNGVRCVAKYALDRHIVTGRPVGAANQGRRDVEQYEIKVQTDRGVLTMRATMQDGVMKSARVDMGAPILEPPKIPVGLPGERCVRSPLLVGQERYTITCVSMGNPHAVLFVPSLDAVDINWLGPLVERHPLFPNRVNLQVASVQSRREVTMKTWERGTGVTLACGTGACAVLVAGVLEGRLDRSATIHLAGGDLEVEWGDAADSAASTGGNPPAKAGGSGEAGGSVYMTGPATEVFSGAWPS
jgi:diaminopimelate epimerase